MTIVMMTAGFLGLLPKAEVLSVDMYLALCIFGGLPLYVSNMLLVDELHEEHRDFSLIILSYLLPVGIWAAAYSQVYFT